MAAGDVTYSSPASLTLTSLTSLASAGYWGSAAIDNNTTGAYYLDAFVGGKIVINDSISADGYIEIYAYGSYDGTTMTAGLNNATLPGVITWSGSLGGLSYQDLRLLGVASVDDPTDDDATGGELIEFGPFSVAQAFGGFLPPKWGIVIKNSTGAALDATGTGNEIKWTGVKVATS